MANLFDVVLQNFKGHETNVEEEDPRIYLPIWTISLK